TARDGVRERRLGNQRLLRDQFGRRIQQAYLRDKMLARRFDSDEPLVVGFAVSEVGPDARAGDLFTAMELGAALEAEFGWRCRYLPRADGAWYDLRDVDVIVGLVNQYDPRSIHHARPHLLRVGWVRNWFDRWVANPGFATYDLVLSSSDAGARYILMHGHRDARVVPIASQPARFDRGTYAADLAADVVFTGSRWGEVRAIERNLQPEQIKGSVALFGAGWPEHPRLQPWARGFVPYERMADVYASAKIVVDDCIEQCRPWGSMNSRVFDALASGALVVTNCAIGSEELFDGRLPTYDSPAQLTELLNTFLADEGLRKRRVATLQASVRADHTYTERAHRFQSAVSSFLPEIPSRIEPGITRRRISIKVPAPRQHAKAWGDYHFALAMQRHLQREGHTVRIDVLEDWSTPAGVFDDIVFVLRGLSRYEPSAHQATVMWNISHPDAVSDEEYESYDAVFVASLPYAEQLKARLKTPVAPLLQ
ncbi:MAG: glycosyltransferase, partial [Myxococcota bacterium]